MDVKEDGGKQATFSLNAISNISFASGILTIVKTDNSISKYSLNGLKCLNFSDLTIGKEKNKSIEKNLSIYPNPVINWLNIDFSGVFNPNGTISILDLQGRILRTTKVTNTGILSVDLSQLSKGIYLCRYSNQKEISTVRVIKQ